MLNNHLSGDAITRNYPKLWLYSRKLQWWSVYKIDHMGLISIWENEERKI